MKGLTYTGSNVLCYIARWNPCKSTPSVPLALPLQESLESGPADNLITFSPFDSGRPCIERPDEQNAVVKRGCGEEKKGLRRREKGGAEKRKRGCGEEKRGCGEEKTLYFGATVEIVSPLPFKTG